jgi:hypothetical protein
MFVNSMKTWIVFLVNVRQQIEPAWLGILWSKVLQGLIVYVVTSMHNLYGSSRIIVAF